MYVRDLTGEEYALQVTSTNNYELSGNQHLSLTIQPNKANDLFIDNIEKMWRVVDHDKVEHIITYLKRAGKGNRLLVDIKAVPLFFDEFDNDRIYEEYNEHMTAQQFFSILFAGSDFNFVLSDSFLAVQWESMGKGDTKLDLFQRGLNRYNAEFRIQGNTVYLEALIGQDTDFMYRYRLNASNIVEETDANEFWTYAKGYGNYEDDEEGGGYQNAALKRDYISPIEDILGIRRRHAPPIMDGRITDVNTMDEAIKKLVDESLKVSVSATIHELKKQGYNQARPQVGDRVFLIDERIGLNAVVRVVDLQLIRNWRGEIIDFQLTFGSPSIAKRHQASLDSARRAITELIEGRRQLPYNALDEAVRIASEALKRAQTELIFDNGIIARDKNNHNRLVVYNSEGLGISSDGGYTFREAITADGFVLSAGAIGRLDANHIQIGPDTEYLDGYDPTEITTDLVKFEEYVEEAFKDGIIEESEAKSIEKYLNIIESEKDALQTQVDALLNNENADDPFLSIAFYDGYIPAYNELVNSINDAIADGKTTEAEKQDVDNRFSDYREILIGVTELIEIAKDSISDNKVNDADTLLRENLRLAAPLPTSISMNQNGIRASTSDPNRYAQLDYRGLYIRGGAIQIDGGLPDDQIENAGKWNRQGTYIDSNGIYTRDITASQISGGTLQSTDGNFTFNMNGSRMDFRSSTRIRFYTGSNQLYRIEGSNAAGVSFPTSQGTNVPMMVVGVDSSGGLVDANSPSFIGLRVHNRDVDHSVNLVTRTRLLILSRADHTNGGFQIITGYDGVTSRAIRPNNNPSNWTYNLGGSSSGYRFSNIFLKSNPDVSSDERLKTDIRDNDLGLAFINDLNTSIFRMKDQEDGRKQYGIIAQQLKSTLEKHRVDISDINMMNQSDDGMYGVQISQLIAPIIKSIQELSFDVERLKGAS